MELDPRHAPRRRDRALDRLDGLTTGAAALALIATGGFGAVAAITTHVPGVSAADATDPATFSDDTPSVGTAPGDESTPQVSSSSPSRNRTVQPQSNAGIVSPPTRSSGRRHASTGGS